MDNPYSITPVRFNNAFKQRLKDNFVQKWKRDLDAKSVLVAYKYIKNEFLYEEGESSSLFYLSFNFDFYVSKIMHL